MDLFVAFEKIADVLSDGARAVDATVGTAQRIKGLLDTPKSARDTELQSLVIELANEAASAKLANAELKMQLAGLKEAALEAERRARDFDRYALWETPAGALVYRLDANMAEGEPIHYLCPACRDQGHKLILQGHADWVKCPRCDTGYQINKTDAVMIARQSWRTRY